MEEEVEEFITAIKKFAYQAHRRMDKIEADQDEILQRLKQLKEE